MEELDLKELFNIFLGKKLKIIGITIIFMVIGIVYTTFCLTPKYQSSTTLVLTQQNANISSTEGTTGGITTSDITLNSKLVSTYGELIKSKSVIRKVISNLGMDEEEEEEIRKSISVSAKDDTEIIEITVVNKDAEKAMKIANETANVFTERVKEIYNINNVSIVDKAEEDDEPYNINHTKDVVIFMFIGIIVAIGYVLITYMFDTSIKSVEDVEKATNIPVLANIPLYEKTSKGGNSR